MYLRALPNMSFLKRPEKENVKDKEKCGRSPSKNITAAVMVSVVLLCAVMAVADGVLELSYVPKSCVKIAAFAVIPLAVSYFIGADLPRVALSVPRKGDSTARGTFVFSICGGVVLFAGIVGGYFLLRDVFDFSGVTDSLLNGEGVTRENFPFVALYITLCNSMLEEFFFRGFAFLLLSRTVGERWACIFSAAAFSLYHAAILDGWFSPLLTALMLLGLFVGGVVFNLLASRGRSVMPSWMFHMAANLGINTVGFILFGIL